jgi:hypothetical protein
MLAGLRFAAIVLTAVALIPGGAHLFALPNKLPMLAEDYFAAQAAYRGWALFAIPLFGAIAANLALGTALWRRDLRAWPAFAAAALILATLAIFFAWTYPANQATENWTIMPETWETLRRQWEYSHAVNAVLTFAALCFVAGEAAGRGRKEALVTRSPDRQPRFQRHDQQRRRMSS